MRGVSSIVLALGMGIWIMAHQNHLFRTKSFEELYGTVGGQVWIIATPILIGGILGLLGLLARVRALSLASCLICIGWFGWLDAFLWYANFTDSPNIVAWICLYGLLEYIYRLVLLAVPPKEGEEYGQGW